MSVVAALLVGLALADGAGAPDDGGSVDGGVADRGSVDSDGGDAGEFGPAAVPAPVGRLTGRVLVTGGRRAVAGAELTANGNQIATTDDGGAFTVELPCGSKVLVIQATGFEPLTVTIDACDVPAGLTYRLVPGEDGNRFETVVRVRPPQPQMRLDGDQLTKTPGSLGDPLRVVESLPGVAAVAWPAPIYAIRGSNPGNTGFFLDGVRIPALFHFALGPSVIHPYFFRGIDFFPGGYPARYGRYVGGIVAAETRPAPADEAHASVDARLLDAGAMVSAPLAGGAVAVAARYSHAGALVTLLGENVRLDYWDYQLRADRRVGPFQWTVLAFGSHDAFLPRANDPTTELNLGFHRLSLRASVRLAAGSLQGSITVGSDHSRAPVLDVFPMVVDALSAAPRLSYGRAFGPVDLTIGFDGELGRYRPVVIGTVQPTGTWDLAQRRDATLLATYLSATVAAAPWLKLTPEVRFDGYDVNGTRARDVGPRLAVWWAATDDTSVRVAGGRFTQLPNLPLQIPGAEAFGLRLLGLQSSWQGSLGVETKRLESIELGATAFIQSYVLTELRNPSLSNPDPLADDLLARREALSYGLELLARRPLARRLHGWLSYTLSKSVRSYGGGAVGPSDWDQRHIVNVVVGYRVGRSTLGARAHLNTGRPEFLHDTYGDAYQRLPMYYQLDLRAERQILFDKFTLNVYGELVNATLNRQVFGITEPRPGQLQKSSYRIVLPSIGVRAEF